MADRRGWPRSVRARTTLLATLVSAVALVLGSVLLLLTLDRSLHNAGDDLARSRVTDLGAAGRGRAAARTSPSVGDEGVAQVFSDYGRVLAASPNIAGAPPITGPATTRDAHDAGAARRARTTTRRRTTGSGSPAPTARTDRSRWSPGRASSRSARRRSTLRRDLLVGVPLLVLLVAAGTWLVVGRTLRPVEDIRAEVAAIGDADLAGGCRCPPPATRSAGSRSP